MFSVWSGFNLYMILVGMILFFISSSEVSTGSSLYLEWEMSEKMLMEMSFMLVADWMSSIFLVVVFFISGVVSVYGGFYMGDGGAFKRTAHLIHIFVFFMSLLVLFPSLWSLVVGWDGLGVSSFLLIIQYQNSRALSGGMFAAVTNRLGDFFFLLAITFCSSMLSYSFVGGVVFISGFTVGSFIMFGSITKSCQIPFCAWLPEAMVAPTPISTLVHSSTLVTAGVYVLLRFSSFISEEMMSGLSMLAIVTILLASSNALVEVDLKKVIALSTLSQVGIMVFLIGSGAFMASFFHLMIHAFLKALMFMCVGGLIFYFGDQDLRSMGAVWSSLPLTSCLFVFSSLSLMGVPFLSGFYSKEMVMAHVLVGNCGIIKPFLLLLSLVFTAVYSLRVVILVFQGSKGLPAFSCKQENVLFLLPQVFMANGAVSMGMMMQVFLTPLSNFGGDIVSWGDMYDILSEMMEVCLMAFLLKELKKGGQKSNSGHLVKEFLTSMWFLKLLSSVLGTKALVFVSKFISLVEMGVVRGWLFESGVKKIFLGLSGIFRAQNFGFMGGLLLFCSCFMLAFFFASGGGV